MLRKFIGFFTIIGIIALVLQPHNTIPTTAAGCTKPASMMLLVDKSNSMEGSGAEFPPYADREDAAKKITSTFVNKINFSQDKVGLMTFAETPRLEAAIGSSKTTILSKLAGYNNEPGTRIFAALNAAYAALPKDNTTARYIIMPTDGKHYDDPGETADWRDAETLKAAATIKNAGVIIVTLGIVDADSKLLDKVATPGYSFFAKSSRELENFFDVVAQRVICNVKTATPKASTTGTPKPATATPKPTLPPGECGTTGVCSRKQIGTYSLNVFSEESTLITGSTYWVKLTIKGRTDYNDGTLVIHEKLNPGAFELVSPTSNIEIYKKVGSGSPIYQTDTICNSGSCLSNIAADSMDISIPNLKADEESYIYFAVKPIIESATSIDVDSTTSNIAYPQLTTGITLDNTKAAIPASQTFFQTSGGDTYSHADTDDAIDSSLPKDKFFTGSNNHVVLYKGGNASFGKGEVNPKKWQSNSYSIHNTIEYESLYNEYKNQIQPVEIKGVSSFKNIPGESIYIEHSSTGNNDLTIGGGNWDNQTIQGKNVVIFVNGDLYITRQGASSYTIAADGKSSLTFVVKGRIGIDPGVTSVQGIFLSDGVIDTSCTVPADAACSPSLTTSPLNSTLSLEGYFFSSDAGNKGGFQLDRKGVPNTSPGELFKARPDFYLAVTHGLGRVQIDWKETI